MNLEVSQTAALFILCCN